MTTVYVSCTPTAVDADGICASQSPAVGAILINGALASFSGLRLRLTASSSGNVALKCIQAGV